MYTHLRPALFPHNANYVDSLERICAEGLRYPLKKSKNVAFAKIYGGLERVMKNEGVYREVFIGNTIQLVAEGGFEMATTRAIAGDRREINNVKLNEGHIYRVFGTKENLFAETFEMLDDELISCIEKGLEFFNTDENFRTQCENLFFKLWRFLLQNEKKCRYYTRYYYSSYFKGDILKIHTKKFEILINTMTPFFVERADVWSLFHHVITVMLDFAIRVYNGSLEDNEDNSTHIFNVVYSSIAPYLK